MANVHLSIRSTDYLITSLGMRNYGGGGGGSSEAREERSFSLPEVMFLHIHCIFLSLNLPFPPFAWYVPLSLLTVRKKTYFIATRKVIIPFDLPWGIFVQLVSLLGLESSLLSVYHWKHVHLTSCFL